MADLASDMVGTGKGDAGPSFGCIEKDYPFPATWICHFDNLKFDAFVFHGRSSSAAQEGPSELPLLRVSVRHAQLLASHSDLPPLP